MAAFVADRAQKLLQRHGAFLPLLRRGPAYTNQQAGEPKGVVMTRTFKGVVVAMAMLLITSAQSAAADPPASPGSGPGRGSPQLVMKTYTYKQVGDLKIEADVYRADDAQARPVLVWLHGGALMMGSKKGVQPDLMELCRSEGYCLVSANYRLAPQVKLPQIIEDLRDFMKWVNEKGPTLFHADASKVVIAGRVRRRLPHHDGRDHRATPQGPGGVLRLRRCGRAVVHHAVGSLLQTEAGFQGRCLQGHDRGCCDRARRRRVEPRPALPLPPPEWPVDQGSERFRSNHRQEQARPVLPRAEHHREVSADRHASRHRGHGCSPARNRWTWRCS